MLAVDATISYDDSKLDFKGFTDNDLLVSEVEEATTGEITLILGDTSAMDGILGVFDFEAKVGTGSTIIDIQNAEAGDGGDAGAQQLEDRDLTVAFGDTPEPTQQPTAQPSSRPTATPTPPQSSGGDSLDPTVPGNLVGASSSAAVTIAWNGSTDENGILEYRVERAKGSGSFRQIATVGGSTTEYSDTDVLSNTQYRYRVVAVDRNGNTSDASSVLSITTKSSEGVVQQVAPGLVVIITPDETYVPPAAPPVQSTPVPTPRPTRAPTPTPAPGGSGSTPTPTPAASPTPTPTPTSTPRSTDLVGDVALGEASYKRAQIAITNQDVRKFFVKYGDSADSLGAKSKEVEWDGQDPQITTEIGGLVPGETYFYQVIALDEDDNQLESDVLSFSTKGYEVNVKLLDANEVPIPAQDVTLFSDPVTGQTDVAGDVRFDNISPGDHELKFTFNEVEYTIPLNVEDTAGELDNTAEAQNFTLVTEGLELSGGSGILGWIIIAFMLLVLAALAIWLLTRFLGNSGGGSSASGDDYDYDYQSDTNVITPGPLDVSQNDVQDFAAEPVQYDVQPESVVQADPNQFPAPQQDYAAPTAMYTDTSEQYAAEVGTQYDPNLNYQETNGQYPDQYGEQYPPTSNQG